MKTKHIVIVILLILFFIILIQNTSVVTLRLFFWEIGASQIILIPIVMAIGFIVGFIVARVTGKQPARKSP